MGNLYSSDPCRRANPPAWRRPHKDLEWTTKFQTTLKEEINGIPSVGSQKPCLLLAGPTSAGKSSLANTFLSTGSNYIRRKAEAGKEERSLTTKYTRYDSVGELKDKFRMCDTMGILDHVEKGIRPTDIVKVIKGNIAPGYKFQEDKDIEEKDPEFVKKPTDKDKSHCLVIVLDSTSVKELLPMYRNRVKAAICAARGEGIPSAIVLTKIDRLCQYVMHDKKKIFACKHTQDAVAETSEWFGLPESNIFPVINYSAQVVKTEAIPVDTIALLTLKQLLFLSYDYLEGPEFSNIMSISPAKT